MALDKTGVTFSFGQGLSLKDDPNLVPIGKFLSLQNAIFDTLGQLRKRNGFGSLGSSIGSVSYVTTFQNNLIGIGTTSNIQRYSNALQSFTAASAYVPPIQVSTLPLSNLQFGQSFADTAISSNGLICEVAVNNTFVNPNLFIQDTSSFATTWTWSIIEQASGQVLSGPTNLISSGGSQKHSPRVFSVGSQFTILYDAQKPVVANSLSFLEYITIPTAGPFTASPVTVISSACLFYTSLSFDGVVASNSGLFVAWNGFDNQLSCSLVNPINNTQSQIKTIGSFTSTNLSVAQDLVQTPPTMWIASANSGGGNTYYLATNPQGVVISSFAQTNGSGSIVISSNSFIINNIAISAMNGVATSFVEINNSYPYDDSVKSNLIYYQFMTQNGLTYSTALPLLRGIGLASKAFVFNSNSYFLGTYVSPYQSTYFLFNAAGQVQAKLAYGNANNASYFNIGLPSVSVVGSSAYVSYLYQNTVSAPGKATNSSSQSGIYASLGVNLAQFTYTNSLLTTKEIGQNLLINGGFLGAYDGQQFTENNFFLYPDSVEVKTTNSSGSLTPQAYFYQAIYQWVDNKGNIFRSAPSIPVGLTVSSGTTALNVFVPTLRTSYKNWPYGGINAPSQVKIYRWSTSNPLYYLTESFIQTSALNLTANVDNISFLDTKADSQILGGEIIYTNGGIVEDVNGPASTGMTTFDSRLWLIDAEDQNLLWFSKQVIEATPVEMSDLFTFYVAPNVGAEGPTGNMRCLAPMDDKLIIFKASAIYYINGVGPDNTGANNQYSNPIFITSAVGCSNQNSIVLIPDGLMFQSNKGIWRLGRDMSTTYIGKDVESFNSAIVLSAITIPNTNQVRFTLNTGVTLLYDYFVNQWGTFNGIPGVSSTLYQGLHTFVNSSSSFYQETPGIYKDGQLPTQMSFQTGWVNLAGLQGYQRVYKSYLLGNYYSPHTFTIGISYDYNSSIVQTTTINPTNTLGSGSQVEQWQLNFDRQQCQTFQLTFNETSSQSAGQGLTLSGLDLVYGIKKKYPRNLGPPNQTG